MRIQKRISKTISEPNLFLPLKSLQNPNLFPSHQINHKTIIQESTKFSKERDQDRGALEIVKYISVF